MLQLLLGGRFCLLVVFLLCPIVDPSLMCPYMGLFALFLSVPGHLVVILSCTSGVWFSLCIAVILSYTGGVW